MSNLTNLVPPLELCKLIPAGEFADSTLGHHRYCIKDGKEYYEVVQRGNTHSLTDVQYPAPTLQEIMVELPASNIYRIKQTWTANFINDSIDNGIKSKNPATAALKLWLKLKGIEDEQ